VRYAQLVRAAFGPAATIAAVEPLHGDASTRRYERLRLRGDGPASVVVMLIGAGRFGGGDEIGGGGAGPELTFVNVARWLAAHGLPVPRIHADRARDEGMLLLEDVGDTTLWAAVEAAPERARPLFAAAVDLLVRLQVAGASAPDAACVAFARRFDAALARAELEHFVEHGVETRWRTRLPDGERAELLGALEPLVAPFAEGPFALSHRDFMAWNIHLHGDHLVLIDFQDALMAPDAFDLAQLLTDRTTITRVDVALARELCARFESGMAAAGRPLAPGFADRYRRCALQHALKVIGRFHFLEVVQGRPGYLAYLPAVYEVGRRMLAELPSLAAARPLLARWAPELVGEPAA
jgi:N-acetylmuramate 1-kinase